MALCCSILGWAEKFSSPNCIKKSLYNVCTIFVKKHIISKNDLIFKCYGEVQSEDNSIDYVTLRFKEEKGKCRLNRTTIT